MCRAMRADRWLAPIVFRVPAGTAGATAVEEADADGEQGHRHRCWQPGGCGDSRPCSTPYCTRRLTRPDSSRVTLMWWVV